MKTLLSKRVHIAWLLMSLIFSAAALIVGIAFLNAPPANSVIIDSPTAVPSSAGTPQPRSTAKQQAQGTASTQLASLGVTQVVEAIRESPLSPGPTSTPPVPASDVMSQALDAATTPPSPSAPGSGAPDAPAPTDTPQLIAVYVSGAVQKPGVYTLALGSRVADAIAAAGGPAGTADLEQINLAARVADEEHLAVPAKGDNPGGGAATVQTAAAPPGSVSQGLAPSPTRGAASGQGQRPPKPSPDPKPSPGKPTSGKAGPGQRININSAGAKDLEELPGIGPVLAQRIVTYRQQNGPFTSIEDLKLVHTKE